MPLHGTIATCSRSSSFVDRQSSLLEATRCEKCHPAGTKKSRYGARDLLISVAQCFFYAAIWDGGDFGENE